MVLDHLEVKISPVGSGGVDLTMSALVRCSAGLKPPTVGGKTLALRSREKIISKQAAQKVMSRLLDKSRRVRNLSSS